MARRSNVWRVQLRRIGVLVVLCLLLVQGVASAGDVEWKQVGSDIDGEFRHVSGNSVAMSADGAMVAIDEPGYLSWTGRVRVMGFDGTSWKLVGEPIVGEAVGDSESATSVAMSSDGLVVAVGAEANSGNGQWAGHVRVFGYDGVGWNQLGADIDGEARRDLSGGSVAMSSDGQTVAVGAVGNDDGGRRSGHVRVYSFDGASWNQIGADIDGEAPEDESGFSVSMNGDATVTAIGSWLSDATGKNSGKVRVYGFDGASWTQIGADINGENTGSQFGRSVALSDDGLTLAAGAPGKSVTAPFAGQVGLHDFDGAGWNQIGADIDGEERNNSSGASVTLSAGGETVAIGAVGNSANGPFSGHTRLFSLSETDEPGNGVLQDGNIVYLANAMTGRYIDSDGVHAGFNVDTSIDAQYDTRWKLIDNNDGTWSLLNQRRNRYLDADGPGSDWNVNQSTKQKDDDLWHIIAQDDETFTLLNTRHNRWLHEDSTHNVNTAETNTNLATRWQITPVD